MATEPTILTVPIKLDAFILNAEVCGGTGADDGNKDFAKIAPFRQPNYTFLRFDAGVVQNDTLDFTDLHKTGPSRYNSRFTNLGKKEPYQKRQGVYLHWIVPRVYRTGSTVSQDQNGQQQARAREGLNPKTSREPRDAPNNINPGDINAPTFHQAPARWLVIRKVENWTSSMPQSLPEVKSWVIESNSKTKLDDIPEDPNIDLQVDYAPFVGSTKSTNPGLLDDDEINAQAEVFIGKKSDATTWTEQETSASTDRVELNLTNSSNQLFADYQPHNGNVFSIIDNLIDSDGKPIIEDVYLSYYVVGWHSLEGSDPLQVLDSGVNRGQRVTALNMIINQTAASTHQGVADWELLTTGTRLLCHGSMYKVHWTSGAKPTNVPADTFYKKMVADQPVAVGTTPLDALLAYTRGHSSTDTRDIQKVEQDLQAIQQQLYLQDDSVDGQPEADDILYNWNFATSAGGSVFSIKGSTDNGSPTQPHQTVIDAVVALNPYQTYLDALSRRMTQNRWDMFSSWWKVLTDVDGWRPKPNGLDDPALLTNNHQTMQNLIAQINQNLETARRDVPKSAVDLIQKTVRPAYAQARDPTLLVGGLESGWPSDFLDKLQVRLDSQINVPAASIPTLNESWQRLIGTTLPAVFSKFSTDSIFIAAGTNAATALVKEFLALGPDNPCPPQPGSEYAYPLYHNDAYGLRDQWQETQAWFPLFVEWTGEYTVIPYSTPSDVPQYWTLEPQDSFVSTVPKMRFGVTQDLVEHKLLDKRTLSGRVLILPQAQTSVANIVNAALKKLPPDTLTPDQITELQTHLGDLKFLSSPLSGFTDHLVTRTSGTHIKPNVRVPVQGSSNEPQTTIEPFDAAVNACKDAGFQGTQLQIMGVETAKTPYSSLVVTDALLPDGSSTNSIDPFKPITNGQFRFTSVNIIDKFGQAVPLIDPTPTPYAQGSPPLYPCISDYYSPQAISSTQANTVVADAPQCCQYIQLPPTINQPARLNSVFVDCAFANDPEGNPQISWSPLNEWDQNHVWGWIVSNYADNAVQLFLPDGTFFREVRQGGASGSVMVPLPGPVLSDHAEIKQLELFAQQLSDTKYLSSFMSMLNKALPTAAPAPSAFADYLSSIIGKPLALVSTGMSIELETAPFSSQVLPVSQQPAQSLLDCQFPIHLGDRSRVYDGLIAYFNPLSTPAEGDVFDFSKLYTHFIDPQQPASASFVSIEPANYPALNPFFIDPLDPRILDPKITVPKSSPQDEYKKLWDQQLTVFGAIVDPFTPYHAYSGALPVKATQLPAWTWQLAMKKMTAFFQMGPLLTTTDVPAYNPDLALKPGYDLTNDKNLVPDAQIGIPVMQTGQWAWLQPYAAGQAAEQSPLEPGQESSATQPPYMAVGTVKVDGKPRFEPGPYVAVEGFMQLRETMEQALTAPST